VTARHRRLRYLAGGLIAAADRWAARGLVQIAPGPPGNARLNDIVIVLFVVDLAIVVSPWL
jgi:hypothetical protein